MRNLLAIFFCIFIAMNLQSQEKIKGSRKVTSQQWNLESFSSLSINGDFEVILSREGKPELEVQADDNLHKVIEKEVINGTLHIGTSKEIRKSKRLRLFIGFEEDLEKILISGNVKLEASEDLDLGNLSLETKDNSNAYLTVSCAGFKLINGDKSGTELNITAETVYFQLNQSSDVEALIKAPEFKADLYEKASAKIEGDIEEFQLRADHSTKFDGKNLVCRNVNVLSEGRSDIKVNASDSLKIEAKGRSKIEIYNEPKIELKEFSGQAILEKKEFDSSLF